jgi:hypothetical protein
VIGNGESIPNTIFRPVQQSLNNLLPTDVTLGVGVLVGVGGGVGVSGAKNTVISPSTPL